MKILAVESSGASLSIAISENKTVIAEYFYNAGMIHSEMIVPMIKKILEDLNIPKKDIDRFAVSSGPGSFTGIRVGMTAVKTLAQSLNKKVTAADCLSILQETVKIKNIKIVPAIDALRNEVYTKNGKNIVIMPINDFVKKYTKYKNNILVIGNAVKVFNKILSKNLGAFSVSLPENLHFPKASALAVLANDMPETPYKNIEPLYIRKSWAEETKKEK